MSFRIKLGLLAWLERPRAVWPIIVVSLLLAAPSLGAGLALDDYVLALRAGPDTRMATFPPSALAMFTFTTGDPARNRTLMDEGVLLPWWTEPHHRNAFFRPLTALTHVLDFRAWPHAAWVMHLHSMLWFGLLLWLLARAYRQLEPSAVLAGLSLLLYALDAAHGATLGWIANRNAIVSAALALPALGAHHRAATTGSRTAPLLAASWIALGLCAGETAICIVAYLAAYALCLDRRPWARRAASLLPYVALLLAHQLLYRALGLGSFGSSAYHNPLQEPLGFARTLGYNLPVLLSAQLWLPVADLGFWGDIDGRGALLAWALLTCGVFVALLWGGLRRDRMARFWAAGMVLSAVPVSASLPGERLLLPIGLGAAPLLARLLLPLLEPGRRSQLQTPRRVGLGALLTLHLVVAPLSLPLFAGALSPLSALGDRLDAGIPRDPPVRDKTVVVLAAPVDALVSYVQVKRAVRGVPRPAHVYWLASASSATRVTRVSDRALQVEQARGFLLRPEETHYRASARGLGRGARVQLSELTARVVQSLPDGRPKRVEFDFRRPLESPRYLFRTYRAGALLPWRPSAIGASTVLAAQDFFRLVAEQALR